MSDDQTEPGGLHIVHIDGGDAKALRVVLVHGALDRHNSFRRTARRLADRRVLLYDRRGYGRSRTADETCDFSKHVADLMRLIGHEPAVVVGHSMGALIALYAGAIYPDRVPAVGAFEPPMPWMPWWPKMWIPDPGETPELTVRNFHERIIGPGSWDRISPHLQDQYIREGAALQVDLGVGIDGPLFDPVDVTVPVVIGHGSRSTEHHIRAAQVFANELRDAHVYVIDGAQHGAHRSHADAFADFAEAAIARNSTTGV